MLREAFTKGLGQFEGQPMRFGAELKFPLVDSSGQAAAAAQVDALWRWLQGDGWSPVRDAGTARRVAVSTPGECNNTVASTESGYCKTEFSLAHVADLHALADQIDWLRELLRGYAAQEEVHFLGHESQPITPPSRRLAARQQRASVWEDVFRTNEQIAPEAGDDVHMFTVNAGSHVHASVPPDQAVLVVDMLNGFAPAQIALGANSRVWRGQIDPDHCSIGEAFWDRWPPVAGRVGMPPDRFRDLDRYCQAIGELDLLYVMRPDGAVTFPAGQGLRAFVVDGRAEGRDASGQRRVVTPEPADIRLHNSCYWYNARISRYYTVENRIWGQQPPDALLLPAAVTVGLISALAEAQEVLETYEWSELRSARVDAYHRGLAAEAGGRSITHLAGEMIAVAETGLTRRGLGEEKYLAPAAERLTSQRCPAERAALTFAGRGIAALITETAWQLAEVPV